MLGFPIHYSYRLRLLGCQLLGFYYKLSLCLLLPVALLMDRTMPFQHAKK